MITKQTSIPTVIIVRTLRPPDPCFMVSDEQKVTTRIGSSKIGIAIKRPRGDAEDLRDNCSHLSTDTSVIISKVIEIK